jgi:hypothetical protein
VDSLVRFNKPLHNQHLRLVVVQVVPPFMAEKMVQQDGVPHLAQLVNVLVRQDLLHGELAVLLVPSWLQQQMVESQLEH